MKNVGAAVAMLAAATALAATSCQAILGIEEGKPRTSTGAGGGAGGSGGCEPGCPCSPGAPLVLWRVVLGGADGPDAATAVAVEPDGSIVVVGAYASDDFTVGHIELPRQPGWSAHGFVAKLDHAGQPQWALRLGQEAGAPAVASLDVVGVAAVTGGVVVVGNHGDDLRVDDLDKGTGVTVPGDEEGARRGYALRINGEGTVEGTSSFVATDDAVAGDVRLSSVASDVDGSVWIVGTWRGALAVDEEPVASTSSSLGAFLVGLDQGNLNYLHSETFEVESMGATPLTIPAVAYLGGENENDVLVGGTFTGTLMTSAGNRTAVGGAADGWAARLAMAGESGQFVSGPDQYGPVDASGGAGGQAGAGGQGGASLPSSREVVALARGDGDRAVFALNFTGTALVGDRSFDSGGRTDGLVFLADDQFVPTLFGPRGVGSNVSRLELTSLAIVSTGIVAFGGTYTAADLGFGGSRPVAASGESNNPLVVLLEQDLRYRDAIAVRAGPGQVTALAAGYCDTLVVAGSFSSSRPDEQVAIESTEHGEVGTLPGHGNGDGFVFAIAP